MTLLANGADPHLTDADGNTLHHAARKFRTPAWAALLRDAGADVNARNHEGVSPLGSACAAGNWRLARFLLERGAQTEIAGGQPALLSAAASDEDDPAGVQLLLQHKARVNARDAVGRSALHGAADHADICQVWRGLLVRRSMPRPPMAGRHYWTRCITVPCMRWKPCWQPVPMSVPAMPAGPPPCIWRVAQTPRWSIWWVICVILS